MGGMVREKFGLISMSSKMFGFRCSGCLEGRERALPEASAAPFSEQLMKDDPSDRIAKCSNLA